MNVAILMQEWISTLLPAGISAVLSCGYAGFCCSTSLPQSRRDLWVIANEDRVFWELDLTRTDLFDFWILVVYNCLRRVPFDQSAAGQHKCAELEAH